MDRNATAARISRAASASAERSTDKRDGAGNAGHHRTRAASHLEQPRALAAGGWSDPATTLPTAAPPSSRSDADATNDEPSPVTRRRRPRPPSASSRPKSLASAPGAPPVRAWHYRARSSGPHLSRESLSRPTASGEARTSSQTFTTSMGRSARHGYCCHGLPRGRSHEVWRLSSPPRRRTIG
jgi:hypothetical protein